MLRTTQQRLTSMLGAVLLAATASTTAAAEPTVACPTTAGTLAVICLQNLASENLALALPTENQLTILAIKELESNGTTTPSELNFGGEQTVCSEAASQGTLNGPATGSMLIIKLFIRFAGCEFVSAPKECEIESKPFGSGESGVITTLLITAEQVGAENGNIVFLPEEANFAEYRLKSKSGELCAEAMSPAKVEGTILGLLLNPKAYQESHLLDLENAGGRNFLIAKNEAHLTLTETLFLDKPTSWASTWDEHPPWALKLRNEI